MAFKRANLLQMAKMEMFPLEKEERIDKNKPPGHMVRCGGSLPECMRFP